MRVLPSLLLALFVVSPRLAATPTDFRAGGVTVQIQNPLEEDLVSGLVTVSGSSSGLVQGRVSVSIDGGPFALATGQDAWTFEWDTAGLAVGAHTITARARECLGCTPAFDTIEVFVEDDTSGIAVTIESPEAGASLFGTVVASGRSQGADEVRVSLDGAPFMPANGTEIWSFVFPAGTLAAGTHSLEVEAIGGAGSADTQLIFSFGEPELGLQDWTYVSSVDDRALTSRLYLPEDFDASGEPVPLVCHLHGAGGSGRISIAMRGELDARGWIGVAPDGRPFAPDAGDCTWPFSPAYFDSDSELVGPAEQDILDLLDWAAAELPVDVERVYLTGFSYGGRGTYMIGLKNPQRFAALAPMGAPTDMYEVDVRRPDSEGCRLALLGGVPGDSPAIDTLFTTTSGRFLLENAYNLPVFHGHGLLDDVASNDPTVAPYLHGWHVTADSSWDACHGDTDLCFGHTPNLADLAARHPAAYDWAYQFTPVGHITDARWLTGTPMAPGLFGTEDPLQPGQLLGIYDFFERRSRVNSPDSIVFKTYETNHRQAYWLELETSVPWADLPAAVRAIRDVHANALDLELVRAASLRVDVVAAQLELTAGQPLHLSCQRLVEPVYDPALMDATSVLEPLLILAGIPDVIGATVLLDGEALDPDLVAVELGTNGAPELHIGPIDASVARTLDVFPYLRTCVGSPNSQGLAADLHASGTSLVARNDLGFDVVQAIPQQFGILFYGFGPADLPLGDGRLCVQGPLFRLPGVVALNASGVGGLTLNLETPPANFGAGLLAPGTRAHFQFWYRDPAGIAGSNTSSALELAFQ